MYNVQNKTQNKSATNPNHHGFMSPALVVQKCSIYKWPSTIIFLKGSKLWKHSYYFKCPDFDLKPATKGDRLKTIIWY